MFIRVCVCRGYGLLGFMFLGFIRVYVFPGVFADEGLDLAV